MSDLSAESSSEEDEAAPTDGLRRPKKKQALQPRKQKVNAKEARRRKRRERKHLESKIEWPPIHAIYVHDLHGSRCHELPVDESNQ
jgi:hypothetical protein